MQGDKQLPSSKQKLTSSSSSGNKEQQSIKPNENDVLCGRGGSINSHSGNEQFRAIVDKYRTVYINARFKQEKRLIAATIVDEIRSLDPPGRFLAKGSDFGEWYAIGDERARDKTSQALRENAPNIRQKVKSSKTSGTLTKQRKRSEKKKVKVGKVSSLAKAPSYTSIVPPQHPSPWPSVTYNPYYAAQHGSTNTHQHHPVPGPYRYAQYPSPPPDTRHYPPAPPSNPVSFSYAHSMPQPLPPPPPTPAYHANTSTQGTSTITSSPSTLSHSKKFIDDKQSSDRSLPQSKVNSQSETITERKAPPEVDTLNKKQGEDNLHLPIKSPSPSDTQPEQSRSQNMLVDTSIAQSPSDAYLMSPGAAAAEAIINMPPSSSPMLESPGGSMESPARKRAAVQSSTELDSGRDEKRPRRQAQDSSRSSDHEGTQVAPTPFSNQPSSGFHQRAPLHLETIQSPKFSVGKIAVPYSPIKTNNQQSGGSLPSQTDPNTSLQHPPPRQSQTQTQVGHTGVMASSLLSQFAEQVVGAFDMDALCSFADGSTNPLAPNRWLSSPDQYTQHQEGNTQIASPNSNESMGIKVRASPPAASETDLEPQALVRTPSWERSFRRMYEKSPTQSNRIPISSDMDSRKSSAFPSDTFQKGESSSSDSSAAFQGSGIEEGSLAGEALNARVATALQQHENNLILNTHTARRQPIIQANRNRTARSSAFDHHFLTVSEPGRTNRQQLDTSASNAYPTNQAVSAFDYQAPLPPGEALDFNIAMQLQKAEQVAIGTMQQLERIAKLDQEDQQAHENRNARSRGYKGPPPS